MILKTLVRLFYGTKITTVPEGLFDLCVEATTFGGTVWNTGVFEGCTLLETIPDKLFYNNTKVTSFARAFSGCSNLKKITEDTFNTSEENVSMYYTFAYCPLLTTIKGQLFKNIPNISNIGYLFFEGFNLKETEEGLIIPESVTNMESTFWACKNLETTITLKSNQASYNQYTFKSLSKSTLNWADPCTEEKVNEILGVTGGIQKGSKVD